MPLGSMLQSQQVHACFGPGNGLNRSDVSLRPRRIHVYSKYGAWSPLRSINVPRAVYCNGSGKLSPVFEPLIVRIGATFPFAPAAKIKISFFPLHLGGGGKLLQLGAFATYALPTPSMPIPATLFILVFEPLIVLIGATLPWASGAKTLIA